MTRMAWVTINHKRIKARTGNDASVGGMDSATKRGIAMAIQPKRRNGNFLAPIRPESQENYAGLEWPLAKPHVARKNITAIRPVAHSHCKHSSRGSVRLHQF